jgi:6-phosphofructokinase 1
MTTRLRIGLLTGGGDCPGLNPAIKSVVYAARSAEGVDATCLGLRDGWRGLLQESYPAVESLRPGAGFGAEGYLRLLDKDDVRTIDRQGGTILGSSRTNPFKLDAKTGQDRSDRLVASIRALGLTALVAIGGEDTLGVLWKLHQKINGADASAYQDLKDLRLIGIPKTIDLDLPGTEYSLGFETAVSIIAEEVDRVRTTAHSHRRVFVVETMGRHAGHLALQGGVAAGADIILIPEVPFDPARVVAMLVDKKARGAKYSIVVVAEGAKSLHAEKLTTRAREADTEFSHEVLGGVGERLAGEISRATGWEVRHVVLSHLQRGGTPVAYDRRMGRLFGVAAVDLILKGQTGRMVAVLGGKIDHIPLEKLDGAALHLLKVGKRDKDDPEPLEYDLERYDSFRNFDNLPNFEEVR